MSIESDFFARKRPDFRKLEAYGFQKCDILPSDVSSDGATCRSNAPSGKESIGSKTTSAKGSIDSNVTSGKGSIGGEASSNCAYLYREEFLDGQFRADIVIRSNGLYNQGNKQEEQDGQNKRDKQAMQDQRDTQADEHGVQRGWLVQGTVIDQETGEEYLPIRIKNQIGEFVGTVRESYFELLGRLADACFVPVHFMQDQSNRIEAAIDQQFNTVCEFPWEKYPGNGTFKSPQNGKWFAAILTVEFGKLSPAKAPDQITQPHEEDEIVEVVNLKADPDLIPNLITRPGVCNAWHMNKKHWISVILDGTLSDEDVMDLVFQSHEAVAQGKSAKAIRSGAWMIPSNPKIYDVDAGFEDGGGEIEWHQHNDILPGDEVYIYSSAPNSAIMYRCEVVASNLPYQGMFQESKGYTRSMRIRLVEKYPKDRFPLSFIKAHGGSVVRSARSMPPQLLDAIRRSF